MSIRFVIFKDIRGVHIESTVHIGFKYYSSFFYLKLKYICFASKFNFFAIRNMHIGQTISQTYVIQVKRGYAAYENGI